MKPATEKREPSPAQLQAMRVRRAEAQQAARGAIEVIRASRLNDPEFRMEVCRATIRAVAMYAAQITDSARAVGLLSGAAAEVSPAYQPETKFTAAEALFARPDQGEE